MGDNETTETQDCRHEDASDTSAGHRATIFVVEDSDLTFRLVSRILQREKLQVIRVVTGEEAMTWLLENEPDLLLADYQLPDMNSEQLLRALQRQGRSFPFVVMTACGSQEVAVRMMQLGALDYIVKDDNFARVLANKISLALTQAETQRKLYQTQEHLHLVKTALESTASAMVLTDRQGHITWANPAFAKLTGYSINEVIGQNPRLQKSGQQDRAFYSNLWQTILSGKPWQGELVNRRKDGSLYTERITITPVQNGQKEITHFIGIKEDITEQQESKRQLAQSEEKYRVLFNKIIDPVFVFEPHTYRFLDCNEAAHKVYGYSLEELRRMTPFDLHPKHELELVRRNIDRPSIDSASVYIHITKAGEHLVVEILSDKIAYQGQEAWLSIVRNITERKKLEGQLAQAQKLESIGQLAAGIAHEINTPIQYVGDNVHFLENAFRRVAIVFEQNGKLLTAVKEGNVDDGLIADVESSAREQKVEYMLRETPDAIRETLEGVERVTKIVLAMKEFSHPGTEEKSEVDLNRCLENTITVARNEWKYVADVETSFESSLPLVPCLPGELNQVFLNLVVNAAHSIADKVRSGTGKGIIRISSSLEKKYAKIKIGDTGTGIPENIKTKIFDPFFTTKSVGKGTGQGLAIAYNVVTEKHGGTITLDTEVGQGTTFTIRLPLEC